MIAPDDCSTELIVLINAVGKEELINGQQLII